MNVIDITIDPEIVLDALDKAEIIEYIGFGEVLEEIDIDQVAAFYNHSDLLDLMTIETVRQWLKENE